MGYCRLFIIKKEPINRLFSYIYLDKKAKNQPKCLNSVDGEIKGVKQLKIIAKGKVPSPLPQL